MEQVINTENKIDIIQTNGVNGVLPIDLKDKATALLANQSFPTTKTEAWKYTRVGKISNKKFDIQTGSINSIDTFSVFKEATTIVFVNGFFDEKLSNLSDQVNVQPLSKVNTNEISLAGETIQLENEVFNTLNTIYATDGAFIQIKANEVIENPIQIINIGTGNNTIAATRNIIVAEKNSKASILISYFSENANETFTNAITEVSVKENAHLSIDKLQLENNTSYQVSTEQIHQDKNSTFTINTITLNGALVRNNLNIVVDGTNCESNLNGVYILKGQQHVDNHTMVDHRVPHCNSNESYKGVMYDKSTAVFNGKVFVRKDAQKTNAFQNNANVLLSNDATVNSKPELEIYADDVKCSHGSTTGQLDEEAVFYLRARGISENSARQLIVSAFMNDIIEKIDSEELKEFIFKKIREEFNWE
jgi:Fe-S cluster assembly protein SufD